MRARSHDPSTRGGMGRRKLNELGRTIRIAEIAHEACNEMVAERGALPLRQYSKVLPDEVPGELGLFVRRCNRAKDARTRRV